MVEQQTRKEKLLSLGSSKEELIM